MSQFWSESAILSSMHLVNHSPETTGDGAGDPRAGDFSDLVRAHHRELLVYATALTRDTATARDIVQDAFIVAYEKREVFDVTRDFATWMRGIVRNKWREWLRKNRRYDLGDHELARMDADIAAWQSSRARNERFVAICESTGLPFRWSLPTVTRSVKNRHAPPGCSGRFTFTCMSSFSCGSGS